MKLSDDYKKNELYDRLFKSIDETFLQQSIIPENERICFCQNMNKDAARTQLEKHKMRCMKKYGTDEGIAFFNINYFPSKTK